MNGKNTELEAVTEDIRTRGYDGARDHLEGFWKGFMIDDDWRWLQERGANSVRVPIGYWVINGGGFTQCTDFERVAPVYGNAWNILKSHFVEAAGRFGISVLVDLHSVPGGANGDSHSGEHVGSAEFWNKDTYQALMVEAVRFMAQELKNYENIVGIQVVNEAVTDDPHKAQFRYYEACLRAVREEDTTMPLIISDSWVAHKFNDWVQDIQGLEQNLGLVVDEHCYRNSTSADQSKSAEKITKDLEGDFLTGLRNNGNGVDFMLGEFSCALSENTWRLSGVDPHNHNDAGRKQLASAFGRKQIELALKRAPSAIYFWSYKYPYNWGEWDYRVCLDGYFNGPRVSMPPDGKFEKIRDREWKAHKDFWSRQDGNYEFDRYRNGFEAGWKDCVAFAEQGSMIGRKHAVRFARRQEHIREKGNLDHLWEFEDGFNKALEEFAKEFYHV